MSEHFLRRCIEKSVEDYNWRNALFLCERLISIRRSTQNFLTFGDCYLKAGKTKKAYLILKEAVKEMKESKLSPVGVKLRYLFGLCCYKLHFYREAEKCLLFGISTIHQRKTQSIALQQSAESLHLLGLISREESKTEKAIDYFRKALKLDPFLWTALEAICELGGHVNIDELYSQHNLGAGDAFRLQSSEGQKMETEEDGNQSGGDFLNGKQSLYAPYSPHSQRNDVPISFLQSPGLSSSDRSMMTPTLHLSDSSIQANLSVGPSFQTPPSYESCIPQNMPAAPIRNAAHTGQTDVIFNQQHPMVTPGGEIPQNALRPASRQKLSNSNKKFMQEFPSPRKKKTPHSSVKQDSLPSLQGLHKLFSLMGRAYYRLCQFQCVQALQILHQIPHPLSDTGWISAMMGRCHFELHDYHQAEKCFDQMQLKANYRTETLEYYSTTLWHLKKEVKLSVLAQNVHDIDKMCPETWIIVGNCFSLQKEHDNALKFFRRAIQVNGQCAYAYTLSAHEYAANEDFEKAIASFRHAIRINGRHYNAWFGLGNIYHRQERFELAAEHYQKAVNINQRSAVIHCFLGITYYAKSDFDNALAELTTAVRLTPTNPMARFHRGKVLMEMKRHAEALIELKEANTIDPNEVSVYYTLGALYKRLGQPGEAMNMYTKAMDVEPKHKKIIKAALESLTKQNAEDVDEDF